MTTAEHTSNQTDTPAPFRAILGDYSFRTQPRYSRVIEIVRETRTQWIEADGTRWWKKNRREVGAPSTMMYDFRIVPPGHEHYDPEFVETTLKKEEVRRFTNKLAVAATQESVEDIAAFIRDLATMLDEWEAGK